MKRGSSDFDILTYHARFGCSIELVETARISSTFSGKLLWRFGDLRRGRMTYPRFETNLKYFDCFCYRQTPNLNPPRTLFPHTLVSRIVDRQPYFQSDWTPPTCYPK